MIALLVLLSLLFLWAVVSDRLARWNITAPITFAVAGIVLSGGDDPVVPLDMDTHTFQRSIELVLAVMLFTDATEAREYARLREPVGEGRLLGLALPASLGLAVLAGALVFPGTGWWLLAVMALVVMPMDLAPIMAFLRDGRVPLRVRAALNIEGGFNDGLISPLFVFCVANIVSAEGDSFADLLLNAGKGALYAVLVGTVLGWTASRLVSAALESGWARPASLRLAALAVPFVTYAVSVLIGGNGFVAAFVAGLWYANSVSVTGHASLELVHDTSHLMAFAAWYAFGSLATEAFADGITPGILLYAALVLLVARFLPVVLALIGTPFSLPERLAIGWFGPRGVTSVVFAVLAYLELPPDDANLVVKAAMATVLLSVVVHGATAEPAARRLARLNAHPAAPPPSTGSG
ncbi:cation:proton antiporter [Streptomyces sp. NPDC005805]|uniref:cation:proton antiporter domain-containing protein n=1 Tax=Streptomyces sp. NPDC005805 TaxID=3157068 RepID=UPI0033D0923F